MKEYSLDEKVIKRGLLKHDNVVLCYIKQLGNHMSTRIGNYVNDDDDFTLLTTQHQNSSEQVQNMGDMVPSTQYNTDIQLSRLEDYNVECDIRSSFQSTLSDEMMNNIATQPQWPICTDESGYAYQLSQQIVTVSNGE